MVLFLRLRRVPKGQRRRPLRGEQDGTIRRQSSQTFTATEVALGSLLLRAQTCPGLFQVSLCFLRERHVAMRSDPGSGSIKNLTGEPGAAAAAVMALLYWWVAD